jgi:arylsulfatase A-like enzyme
VRKLNSERFWLPNWLDAAGYSTAHVGKYLNGYGSDGDPKVPAGWDEWYGQISEYDPSDVGGRLYYNYKLLEKGPVGDASVVSYGSGESDYETDVIRRKAVEVLGRFGDEGSPAGERPFFLELAFHAPHYPFVPAPRHAGAMAGASLARLPGLNEKNIADKPGWLRLAARGRIKRAALSTLEGQRRARLEQLLSVDEAVQAVFSRLIEMGELSNTFVIFSSDNGYFFGEHRITTGKYLPHEPSARVPLAIRGPGLPAGVASDELAVNTDVAPTIAALSGVASPPPGLVDGRSLVPFMFEPGARSGRPILLEADTGPGTFTRFGAEEPRRGSSAARKLGLAGLGGVEDLEAEAPASRFGTDGNRAPAYRAIRSDRYLFVVYATGQAELYDMRRDPNQLRAVTRDPRYRKVKKVMTRRLIALARCQGADCNRTYRKEPKPKPKNAKRRKRR